MEIKGTTYFWQLTEYRELLFFVSHNKIPILDKIKISASDLLKQFAFPIASIQLLPKFGKNSLNKIQDNIKRLHFYFKKNIILVYKYTSME
ncbi:hypothetical protein CN692_12325 [Bacillus sp. AFS002410]|uniref:hypothetical protein n=1 Tax=Bacillus sp. AFS002410 TaxID=2033481 RepID=UPI000BF0AD34|nr:hypothetical protein [Bacillus sp. AFS002410]PEJ57457.1 hypothetical protein CN692_12325 [Bacillus sp. AFS002410]